jgi:hypothetical protein
MYVCITDCTVSEDRKEMSFILNDLQDSALVNEPKWGGGGGVCRVSAKEYSCAHGAQINFGDPTPYLAYGLNPGLLWFDTVATGQSYNKLHIRNKCQTPRKLFQNHAKFRIIFVDEI